MKSKRRPIKRIYHHYETWECYLNGMYVERRGELRAEYVQMAVTLLRNPEQLRYYMETAAREWFHSAQNHLTSRNSNRQAWMGQVACSYAYGVGESETRDAWRFLTEEERQRANDVADEIILIWEGWHYEYEDSFRA